MLPDLLPQLLNALPDGVVWLRALRDEQGHLIDFQVDYANQTALTLAPGVYQIKVGHQIIGTTQRSDPGFDRQVFEELRAAFESDQPQVLRHFLPGSQLWSIVSRRRLADGILSVIHMLPAQGETADSSAPSLPRQTTATARRAHQALEQARADLQNVIDNSQTGIFVFSPVYDDTANLIDFRFKIINRMVAALVGQTPDILTGAVASDWFMNYRRTGLFDRYKYVLVTGESQRFEVHYNVDGFDLWFDVNAVRSGSDVLVTFTDFTDLKRAQLIMEQQALANERQALVLTSVLNSALNGIIAFEAIRDETGQIIDFQFVSVNDASERIVGVPLAMMMDSTLLTIFPGNVETGLFASYVNTVETGEPTRVETYYKHDGLDVWLDISARKLGDGFVVTFTDFTPLKQAQQQLEASVVELRRSNANLEQFAYVASHDLQEPLRKIVSFGDVLRDQYTPALGEDGADLIARMQSAASRMQVLIRDVLAYSRIAAKRDSFQPVSLQRIVADVLIDLETAIQDKQAVVTVAPLPTLTGDAGQLRQLFQNLFSNALKFTKPADPAPPDTRPAITISTRLVRGWDAGITIPPGDANRLFHLISVTDNGIGFEPEQADRIFQVFQRLHGRGNYPGTGIGLAIVQKVVENHQGYIQADGRPGLGATFRLLLPAT